MRENASEPRDRDATEGVRRFGGLNSPRGAAAAWTLGHCKLESTVRHFRIEVGDALEMAEQP
jgi:hypothetical protein